MDFERWLDEKFFAEQVDDALSIARSRPPFNGECIPELLDAITHTTAEKISPALLAACRNGDDAHYHHAEFLPGPCEFPPLVLSLAGEEYDDSGF